MHEFNNLNVDINSENFLKEAKEKFSQLIQEEQGIEEILRTNDFIKAINQNIGKNNRVQMIQMNIKKMLQEIEEKNFSWDNYEDKLDDMNDYFSLFLDVD